MPTKYIEIKSTQLLLPSMYLYRNSVYNTYAAAATAARMSLWLIHNILMGFSLKTQIPIYPLIS